MTTARLGGVAVAAALTAARMVAAGAAQSAMRPQTTCNDCADQMSVLSRGALRAACQANRAPETAMAQHQQLSSIREWLRRIRLWLWGVPWRKVARIRPW